MVKYVEPGFKFAFPEEVAIQNCKLIEQAGRTCYKSEGRITDDSYHKFIRNLVSNHHEAMLEHSMETVIFTIDRGLSHEFVRHRLCAFAQESTRWCNYSKDKFENEISVIIPSELLLEDENLDVLGSFYMSCGFAEATYFNLLNNGVSPEAARSVLPTCLKTELVVTANLREWRHILDVRTGVGAHRDMRNLCLRLLKKMYERYPDVFFDFEEYLNVVENQ